MNTIEKEFTESLRASRHDTLFQLFGAIIISLAATIVILVLVAVPNQVTPGQALMGTAPERPLSRFAQVLLARGIIQPINLFLFALGVSLLVMRQWRTLRREEATLKESFFEGMPRNENNDVVITDETAEVILTNTRQLEKKYHGSPPILIRRLQVGSRQLRQTKNAEQVQSVLQTLSDIDHEKSESGYGGIRYLVWLIPTLGFLGTVVGIGLAITGFAGVVGGFSGGAEKTLAEQIKPLLGSISHDLGIAFDTTLLALLLSAILVAVTAIIQGKEEALLSDLDEFCLRHFISRIVMPDTLAQSLAQVMQQSAMIIMDSLDKQLKEIKAEVIGVSQAIREAPGLEDAEKFITRLEKSQQAILTSLNRIPDSLETISQNIRRQTEARQSETHDIRQAVTSLQTALAELNQALQAIQKIRDLGDVKDVLKKLQAVVEEQKQWLAAALAKAQDRELVIVVRELKDVIKDLREKGIKTRIDVQAMQST